MKVTETMHLQRTQRAVEQLRRLLAIDQSQHLVYRLAVARRFSVSYYAFFSYLIERLNVDEETAFSLTMEEVMFRCRSLQLFSKAQEKQVMKMGMIYASLTCYDEGYQEVTDEILAELPLLASFLEQYCLLQMTVTVPQSAPSRPLVEYSV